MELVDGSAVLWRLRAPGHSVGDRWRLAEGWRARIAGGHYAFGDPHAMMVLVGLGDVAAQRELIANVERAAAEGSGINATMAREVGLPACLGFAAFGRGDHAEAVARLLPVRGKASRFGGSHAQRDVFSWTLMEAALRLGDKRLGDKRPAADAMAAERLAAKPDSPINLAWARRGAAPEAGRAA